MLTIASIYISLLRRGRGLTDFFLVQMVSLLRSFVNYFCLRVPESPFCPSSIRSFSFSYGRSCSWFYRKYNCHNCRPHGFVVQPTRSLFHRLAHLKPSQSIWSEAIMDSSFKIRIPYGLLNSIVNELSFQGGSEALRACSQTCRMLLGPCYAHLFSTTTTRCSISESQLVASLHQNRNSKIQRIWPHPIYWELWEALADAFLYLIMSRPSCLHAVLLVLTNGRGWFRAYNVSLFTYSTLHPYPRSAWSILWVYLPSSCRTTQISSILNITGGSMFTFEACDTCALHQKYSLIPWWENGFTTNKQKNRPTDCPSWIYLSLSHYPYSFLTLRRKDICQWGTSCAWVLNRNILDM